MAWRSLWWWSEHLWFPFVKTPVKVDQRKKKMTKFVLNLWTNSVLPLETFQMVSLFLDPMLFLNYFPPCSAVFEPFDLPSQINELDPMLHVFSAILIFFIFFVLTWFNLLWIILITFVIQIIWKIHKNPLYYSWLCVFFSWNFMLMFYVFNHFHLFERF